MRVSLRRVPLPAIGYVVTLVGFVFLGGFTAALALRSGFAIVLGAAMVASYVAAVLCFVLRARHIAAANPADDIVLSMDPIRGNTDRRGIDRYLAKYRSQNVPAPTPVVKCADSDNRLAEAA